MKGRHFLLTRRKFQKLCVQTTVAASLSQLLLPDLARALRLLPGGKPPVLWIEGTSCTGNTVSLDNSADPALREVLEEIIDLRYSQLLMWPQNDEAGKSCTTPGKSSVTTLFS